jgi:hypothetical protein
MPNNHGEEPLLRQAINVHEKQTMCTMNPAAARGTPSMRIVIGHEAKVVEALAEGFKVSRAKCVRVALEWLPRGGDRLRLAKYEHLQIDNLEWKHNRKIGSKTIKIKDNIGPKEHE